MVIHGWTWRLCVDLPASLPACYFARNLGLEALPSTCDCPNTKTAFHPTAKNTSMTARQTRLAWLIAGLIVLALSATLVVNALRQNMVFFHTPTEIRSGSVPAGQYVRIGGLVASKSVVRQPDGIAVHFDITDNGQSVPVVYRGILPGLFQESKGVVAQGEWDGKIFAASEVLAKHDENYMPPEAQEALNRHESAASSMSGGR